MKKRHNPYNVDDMMAKYSISKEEAEIKIIELKNKTKGSLERFIEKYGEIDGREKFESFCRKSAHTKDTFKIKFGDQWEDEWERYIESKNSGKQRLIEKYGEEIGSELFSIAQEKRKNTLSRENQIKKFGEDGFNKICKKKSNNLETFISKFGEENGTKIYNDICKRKGEAVTLDGFIEKYGEKIGTEKYNERSIYISPIYQQLKKEYGEKEALLIYLEHKNKSDIVKKYGIELENISKAKSKRFFRKSKGPTSNESFKFFSAIENMINRSLFYGKKSNELKLFDKDKNKLYYYDCLDLETKTIIEFHGVAFHPKFGDFEWISPFGRKYHEAIECDSRKKFIAEEAGYKYISVYSDEVKHQHNFKKQVELIVKILINESN